MSQKLFKNITKILDPARCVTTDVAMKIAKSKTDFLCSTNARSLIPASVILASDAGSPMPSYIHTLQRA